MASPYTFISYAREDSEFVRRVAAELRQKGVSIWLDKFDIHPGDDWNRAVDAALEGCECFLLVVSPSSIASDNVMDELAAAMGDGKRVVPLLYQPCRMPLRIRRLHYIDFTAEYVTAMGELIEALAGPPSYIVEKPKQSEPEKADKIPPSQYEDFDVRQEQISITPNGASFLNRVNEFYNNHRVTVFALLFMVCVAGLFGLFASVNFNGNPPGDKPSESPTITPTPSVENPTATPTPAVKKPPTANFVDILPNNIQLEMVAIPSGSFAMGAEKPIHRVTLKPFYIGKYEVTQAQWKAVMGDNPSQFKGDNRPVENVSWKDSQEFCKKLSQMTGKQYRLPSEAEWEYAARAGSTGDYCFGNDEFLLNQYAWYDVNSVNTTHRVGEKKPNAWGLYDMHGNVWEWVEDVWHENYKGAPIDGSAWVIGGDTYLNIEWRITRGGSWSKNQDNARAVYRSSGNAVVRFDDGGFRLVMHAPS